MTLEEKIKQEAKMELEKFFDENVQIFEKFLQSHCLKTYTIYHYKDEDGYWRSKNIINAIKDIKKYFVESNIIKVIDVKSQQLLDGTRKINIPVRIGD